MILTQYNAGPYLGSAVVRGIVNALPDKYIIVQYMPISKVLSDTEYKTALQSMERTIKKVQPSQIISLDDDYLKYMSPELQAIYNTKFRTLVNLEKSEQTTCDAIDNLLKRSYMNDSPIYILRDENTLHGETARNIGDCLRDRGHSVDSFRIQSLGDLKRTLTDLRGMRKGLIISLLTAITEDEFKKTLDQDRINSYILRMNSKHIDMAFAKGNTNLSIVLVPQIVGARIENDTIQIDQVIPKLYLNPERLKKLDASILYKNMFNDIIGVMPQ